MKPEISIIIPIGPGRKMEALESLKRQKIPIEIIVEKGKNPSANRNNGIKKAKAPLIAFINAHSILPEDWAIKVVNFFNSHPDIDVVGGPQLNHPREGRIGKVSGYALSSLFGSAEASMRYAPKKFIQDADERFLTSANLICRSKVAKKIKFNESLYPGEDPKFIEDSKKAGFRVAYDPKIFIFHRRRETIADFAKQIFGYGLTRPKKESLMQTAKHPSFLVPPFFTLYLALFSILSLWNSIFIIPLALYLALLIIFSVYEAIKNKDISSMFILPFIFFVIHISYGLGFIHGLLTRK